MKIYTWMFNHEIWRYCEYCKITFDARSNCSINCPDCGKSTQK